MRDCPKQHFGHNRTAGAQTKGIGMTRKLILALAAGAMALAASACNTVRGAGQDLQSIANDVDQAI